MDSEFRFVVNNFFDFDSNGNRKSFTPGEFQELSKDKMDSEFRFFVNNFFDFDSNENRKSFSLGNSKSCPNPVSELSSDKRTPQEKSNKIFRLFRNKRAKKKKRFPQGPAPEDRAFAGTFGFRNNHPCAEKNWFNRRSKLWKTAPGLTVYFSADA